ncbi:hypothetical protein [Rhodobacter ferrooxidans]|uniref:hypothetical protein n=1 Tax=Rhodobacter ferrooxidans TaxID=371731 RepID=UPI0012EA8B89|nr:hypothetical protein [Rhodobacter sp. SW2]
MADMQPQHSCPQRYTACRNPFKSFDVALAAKQGSHKNSPLQAAVFKSNSIIRPKRSRRRSSQFPDGRPQIGTQWAEFRAALQNTADGAKIWGAVQPGLAIWSGCRGFGGAAIFPARGNCRP